MSNVSMKTLFCWKKCEQNKHQCHVKYVKLVFEKKKTLCQTFNFDQNKLTKVWISLSSKHNHGSPVSRAFNRASTLGQLMVTVLWTSELNERDVYLQWYCNIFAGAGVLTYLTLSWTLGSLK